MFRLTVKRIDRGVVLDEYLFDTRDDAYRYASNYIDPEMQNGESAIVDWSISTADDDNLESC